MRVAFFILVALNVIYLGWAGWVDAPPPRPPVASTTGPSLLPLTLVSEEQGGSTARSQTGDPSDVLAPVGTTVSSAANSRCVSVGPFNDLAQAARSAALLRGRGFEPRQRAEAGEMWAGYWVYVGGLGSTADETKVMKTLERAGISDAATMPPVESGRRVSVGLFSERDRAEKRADAVKRLGLAPEITERKQAGTVYWVDLDLSVSDRTVPTEGLLSGTDAGSRLEIRMCPAAESPTPAPSRPQQPRDSRPATTTASAGSSRPG